MIATGARSRRPRRHLPHGAVRRHTRDGRRPAPAPPRRSVPRRVGRRRDRCPDRARPAQDRRVPARRRVDRGLDRDRIVAIVAILGPIPAICRMKGRLSIPSLSGDLAPRVDVRAGPDVRCIRRRGNRRFRDLAARQARNSVTRIRCDAGRPDAGPTAGPGEVARRRPLIGRRFAWRLRRPAGRSLVAADFRSGSRRDDARIRGWTPAAGAACGRQPSGRFPARDGGYRRDPRAPCSQLGQRSPAGSHHRPHRWDGGTRRHALAIPCSVRLTGGPREEPEQAEIERLVEQVRSGTAAEDDTAVELALDELDRLRSPRISPYIDARLRAIVASSPGAPVAWSSWDDALTASKAAASLRVVPKRSLDRDRQSPA